MSVLAWHFTDGDKLRDGRPLPAIGETLRHDGPLVPCKSGLHASERVIDALDYAPGTLVHRVELDGEMLPYDGDKWCARERTILWSVEAEDVLRKFARLCALDVIHLWDAPQIVRDWLATGDNALMAAARAAAWAARDAAWAAAWEAGAAAWAAASDAAGDAAQAARDAAWAAAWAAARDAAQAARDSAWAAAWAAARDAARAAASDATQAARDAAGDAQNARLEAMLIAAHEGSQ